MWKTNKTGKLSKKAGLILPGLFDYENSIVLRNWIRDKLSQNDCTIHASDLMHPAPIVRTNAKMLHGQPNEYLRSRLEKAVRALNRKWTNSTGPG